MPVAGMTERTAHETASDPHRRNTTAVVLLGLVFDVTIQVIPRMLRVSMIHRPELQVKVTVVRADDWYQQ